MLARKLIEQNREKVEIMAKSLLDWETLDAEQVNDIMAGRPPRPPKPSGGASNTPSTPPGGEPGVVAPHPAA